MLDAFYGIRNFLKGLKNTLFADTCALCTRETRDGKVCGSCDTHLDMALLKSPAFHLQSEDLEITCAACFVYNNDHVIKLIYTLKNHGDKETVNYCALRMSKLVNLMGIQKENCIFTAVPRSYSGVYKFGFDQSQLVAKRTADIFSSAKYRRLLVRRGFSKEQKKLNEQQRKINAAGKFRVKRFNVLNGNYDGNIVIFDDVCTTGASVLECAKVIKRKYRGANVCAIFLARNDLKN